jgi:hypothetical protein
MHSHKTKNRETFFTEHKAVDAVLRIELTVQRKELTDLTFNVHIPDLLIVSQKALLSTNNGYMSFTATNITKIKHTQAFSCSSTSMAWALWPVHIQNKF